MWADNETADDLIGFQVHADLICEVIRDKQLLPVTIGVFGDWGIGKSSIMQMIQQKLDAEHPKNAAHKKDLAGYAVLYFNGWLFEGYDDAKSALLSSILEQLSEHKRFGPKLRDRARGLLGRVNFMRIAKIGWDRLAVPAIATMLAGGDVQAIAALNAVIVPTSGDVDEVIKDSNEAKGIASIRSFRDDFAKLLKQSDIVTLVVLIDDLDRCSPERLIENLEAIKLFLSVENTAFVIGADPRMVRHAITVRYKDSIDAIKNGDRTDVTHLVTDYLEKLIQIPYTLPRLSPSEIETYLTLLFCKRDLDPEDYQICVSACERARGINRFKSFGGGGIQEALKGKTLPEKLLSALLFSSSAAPLITEGLKGNPRQVKRFLNAYFLRSKLANVAKLSSVREDVLIKLMILEYTDLELFKELARWQEREDGFPKRLQELESSPSKAVPITNEEANRNGWAQSHIVKWLQMEPRLAEVDLRDYFWLVRDKLASTMSGLSMVSPIVRQIFENLLMPATRRAASSGVDQLDTGEMASLHVLLRNKFLRDPKDQTTLTAFQALIEVHPESATVLAKLLEEIPLEKLAPSYHGIIQLLIKANASHQTAFAGFLKRVREDDTTPIGRAASAAIQKQRGS